MSFLFKYLFIMTPREYRVYKATMKLYDSRYEAYGYVGPR
jgi:hypothetical protein